VKCKKERRIRRRERREQRDEEYRLCEQQGLSPPASSDYSSSGEGEEEESDGGQAPPERWGLRPLTESHGGGRGASAWGRRGSARHRALYRRGDARRGGASTRRGGVWECCRSDTGRRLGVRLALEEEKAGLLNLEVSSRFPKCSGFEGLELKLLSSC
jgi:hypothetical protein